MSQNGWLPAGSTTTNNPDGTLGITPPSGWDYAGYDDGGELHIISGGGAGATVSCTCNTSGTCSPFKGSGPGGDVSGCAGTCTNCTMTQSVASTNFGSGGYFNASIEAAFVEEGTELPGPFEALFDVPEIQDKINAFLDAIYQGAPLPTITYDAEGAYTPVGYKFAGVNIGGRFVHLPVPDSAIPAGIIAGGKSSCSCTQGSCTLKSKGLGPWGAEWCEGDCSGTCSLSTSIAAGGGGWSVINQAEAFQF